MRRPRSLPGAAAWAVPLLVLLAAGRGGAAGPSANPHDDPTYRAYRVAAAELPDTANRGYRLLAPRRDGAAADATFPLVVYLHGSGAKGDDNAKQLGEPLPKLLAKPELRARFPCYILVPQCRAGDDAQGRPNNWVKWDGMKGNPPAKWERSEPGPSDQLRAAGLALDEVLAAHPVDPKRVYLAGVSMGGSAAFHWAACEPERFAGVLAVCGLSEADKGKQLARVPLWVFHGDGDAVVPVDRARRTVAAVRAAGGAVKYTEYAGAGHNIAERAFAGDKAAALEWLFTQKRAGGK